MADKAGAYDMSLSGTVAVGAAAAKDACGVVATTGREKFLGTKGDALGDSVDPVDLIPLPDMM